MFSSLQSLLALVQGDKEKLFRHGLGLANALEIGYAQDRIPL